MAADYKAVIEDAGDRVKITGLQIDYDSPTTKLDAYARFLRRRVREKLPSNHRLSMQLSIVGAVYDRASFVDSWKKRAVIDRA